MTFRLYCAALAVVIAGSTAHGQSLRVLSGEHADFTRLAIVFPQTVTWTAGRTAEGYRVDLNSDTTQLDLSRVFDLIPRTRIKSVSFSPESGQLDVVSDCECFIEVFDGERNVLVIDVKSGTAPADNQFEARLDVTRTPSTAAKRAGIDLLQATLVPDLPRTPQVMPSPKQTTQTLLAENSLIGTSSSRTMELEKALIASLGRAGSQGLVELALPEKSVARDTNDAETLDKDEAPAGQSNNLRSQTTFDRESRDPPIQTATPDGIGCYEPKSLMIAEWGMGMEPKELLPALHSLLVQDSNDVSNKALLQVARGYLYLGFGVEAQQYLAQHSGKKTQRDMLAALGNIIDEQVNENEAGFSNMTACPNASAMWSLLESTEVTPDIRIDPIAVQRAFFELPPHLRSLLGPRLSSRLSMARQDEAARIVLNALRRSTKPLAGEAGLVDAHDAMKSGKVEHAMETLQTVATENSDKSPEALIRLLETHHSNGTTAPDELMGLATALTTELEGTPEANELRSVLSRLLAKENDFEGAFDMARGNTKDPATDQFAALADPLVKTLTKQAPDPIFLSIAFKEILPIQPNDFEVETRLDLGNRLLKLGFTEEADQVTTSIVWASDINAQNILAEIKIKQNQPEAALRFIAGRSDSDAQNIRAKAMSAIDLQAEAAASFAEAGNPTAAAAAAWLSGEQNPIASFGNELQSRFLASIAPAASPDLVSVESQPDPTVQRALQALNSDRATRSEGRQLLGQSEAFRSAAQDLLNSQ